MKEKTNFEDYIKKLSLKIEQMAEEREDLKKEIFWFKEQLENSGEEIFQREEYIKE